MLRTIKYGVNGAVLAGLIAAPVLWTNVDKSVHLVVDGKTQTVRTTAANVGDVLRTRGLKVTGHDLVAPSEKSHVADGSRIVLRRGRLLNLDVDGKRIQVWTTEPTVSEALRALGYAANDFVSVSRSRRLPLHPTDISIRTPHVVQILHDGVTDQITTTDPTVGALLTDLGLTLGADDRVSAPMTAGLHDGEVIRLQRVGKKLVTQTQQIKYGTTKKDDSTLAKGATKVITSGKNGSARVTYALVYVDGKLAGKTKVKSVTVTKPRTQVLSIGTKKVKNGTESAPNTPSAPAPSPGSSKAIAKELLAKRGWGDNQYSCLVQMWDRESGWSTHAANPSGAYGIPQALPGSKMSSAGPDWQNSATTQIKWGIGYIAARYSTPCGAWSFWQGHNYY